MAVAFTGASIALFAYLNSFYPEVTVAPLSATIILFILSIRFQPRVIFLCSLLTLLYVVISLLKLPTFDAHTTESVVRFWLRTLSFCVAGVIAIIASFFRTRLLQMLDQMRQLLGELPVAIILSDEDGRVTWANQASKKVIGTKNLEGRPYSEVIPSDGTPIDHSLLLASVAAEEFVRKAVPDHDLQFSRIPTGRRILLATVLIPKKSS